MSRHKITAERSGHSNGMDWEACYVIMFDYVPGRPAIIWGDPPQPAEPAEVSFVAVAPETGELDHGAFTDLAQQSLDDWARDWLDENYEAALEVVAGDDERAREYAAELRADR
jgi:hypothetical protein